MKIEAFGHTDIGKKRNFNEDSYFCFDLSETVGREDNLIYVLAVADGIGGHVGGEMASFVATQTLRENLLPLKNKAIPLSKFQELFEDSFRQANQKIFLKASEDRSLRGMGTTLVGALIFNNHATISNVGDSRAYLIREDAIHQITQDHSWMAEQLKQNSLTEAEVLNSPFKSMITRSIGFAPELEVDTFQIEISDGDYILLCTDGLYSSLSDKKILKILRSAKDPEKICRKLIKQANQHGGQDNITAVVARFEGKGRDGALMRSLSDTVKLDDWERKKN